ncbi:MAG TPA: ABC transporter permease [Blastocatellia bacterium]|nr:ABC transporter permease [Blastocatellia bacterium]
MLQDLRYGARMLTKHPGFTVVATLALALGIGANTAIFSVLDKALVRPLPVPQPERLVGVSMIDRQGFSMGFSYLDYVDCRDRNEVFDGLAGYHRAPLSLNLEEKTERIDGMIVTGNYFAVLGVDAALGRSFAPEEDQTSNRYPVAIISYGCWQRRFGADPKVVGQSISLSGHPFTVIGIAPAEFSGTIRGYAPEIYVPTMMLTEAQPAWDNSALTARGLSWLSLIGRLKPGATLAQAEAAMTALAEQIQSATNRGQNRSGLHPVLKDGRQGDTQLLSDLSLPLRLLMGVVGLILLIACANVANLLLGRAAARQKEIAVRLAVGASRWRLIRQLLTESLLLSLIGGAGGLMLALWLTDLLTTYAPSDEYGQLTLDGRLDLRVLGFALLLTLLTSLVFGLVPALQASKPDLLPLLKDESGAGGAFGRRFGLKNVLVAAQVALSLVVLVGAGLCLKSLRNLNAIDTGFDTAKVFVMSVDPGAQGYDEARGQAFYAQLTERVAALPGVESVSLASIVPLGRGAIFYSFDHLEGYQSEPGERLTLPFNIVSADYFKTMGVRLVAGRDFRPQDNAAAPKVALINEAMAQKYWPGGNPLGKHIDLGSAPDNQPQVLEIIGIVRNSKYLSLTENAEPTFYQPLQQAYAPDMALQVRTAGDAGALIAMVRDQVQALDANLPVFNVKTMAEQKRQSLYSERMAATLMTAFGLLALGLASIGIYGVMAYLVSCRTREIGIRIALGAQVGDVLSLVLRQGMAMVLIGVAFGLAGAFAATRLLTSFLYGVSTSDATTFALVALLLAAVALVACYLPARRAAKVDPMVALRYE